MRASGLVFVIARKAMLIVLGTWVSEQIPMRESFKTTKSQLVAVVH